MSGESLDERTEVRAATVGDDTERGFSPHLQETALVPAPPGCFLLTGTFALCIDIKPTGQNELKPVSTFRGARSQLIRILDLACAFYAP